MSEVKVGQIWEFGNHKALKCKVISVVDDNKHTVVCTAGDYGGWKIGQEHTISGYSSLPSRWILYCVRHVKRDE